VALSLKGADGAPLTKRGPQRQVYGSILAAFHTACDEREFVVAIRLLNLLEFAIKTYGDDLKSVRLLSLLVAAHERLWLLRHGVAVLGDRLTPREPNR
jgi:hypothetical protein